MSRPIKILLAVCVLGFFAWLAYGSFIAEDRVDAGENVNTVDWLPTEATNVSYYRSYSFTAYEFDISEDGFNAWSQWPVEDVSDAKTIPRYVIRTEPELPQPSSNPTDEQLLAYHDARENRYAKITDGLYYEHRQLNGGGVYVGYDRKQERVFYQSSPR